MPETWTAAAVDRTDADLVSGERAALEQWLDYHRATLLTKCAGLTAEQLKLRPIPPSRLALLGLVRHMTDVERWWFRMHAAEEKGIDVIFDPDWTGADFEALDDADAESDLAAFRDECEASRVAVASRSLDDVVPSCQGPSRPDRDIRWIFIHMIEEYARHNGHADLLREAIDGVTGD